MKVLGILGSPRRNGNTEILLDKALDGAKQSGAEIEKIILNELKIEPCQECQEAGDEGVCIIDDDMQDVYRKVKEADKLILASPIFFGSLTAQTKIMIDRFQCAWRAKYISKKDIGYKNKKGAFISVQGAQRKDFFENAKGIVKNIFAAINVSYEEELFCYGVDEKNAILRHKDCLNKAFELGKRLAREV